MKKARNILVVTLMLVSVLSFGSVANTYAKYTSTAELSDTARVARWDVQLSDGKTWTTDQTIEIFKDKIGNDKVIAPGSTGTITIPAITNNSEVDAKYTISLESDTTTIPLEYCVDNCGGEYPTGWSNTLSASSANGVLAPNASVATQTVYWRWAFYVNDDTDIADTTLGTAATLANVKIKLRIVAEQATPGVASSLTTSAD